MKIAFLSDIHGNAVALEAVLEDIYKHDVDKIVVLGDICYRGPEPKRSLQMVQSLEADVIKGNADEWLVRGIQPGEVPDHLLEIMNKEREWSLQQLTSEDINYLRELPVDWKLALEPELHVHAFHATPTNLFDIVLPDSSAEQLQEKLMSTEEAALYLYAHIHTPFIRFFQGKCVANIGSVGLPFDGISKSSYALVEADQGSFRISIERVPYDLEKVVKQYNEWQYPNAKLLTRVIRHAVSSFK